MNHRLGNILLIDDDEPTNFLHQRILERSNIADHIEIAWNGEEALALLQSKTELSAAPDLIFLDINMPVMDGWEFLDAYEKLDPSLKAKVVVVMLTTSINPDDRRRAESIDYVAGYLHKPLKMEMVEAVLSKHFA